MALFGTFKFGEAKFGYDTVYVYMTPDLGWPNKVAMLSNILNSRAVIFDTVLLEYVGPAEDRIMTPDALDLNFGSIALRVPRTVSSKMGKSGRYAWRLSIGDVVNYFIMSLEAESPGRVPDKPNVNVPAVT